MELECREVTEQIIGAAYEVHRVLGYGYLEKVYQKALQAELVSRGLKAEIEHKIKVHYKGIVVGDYAADLLVDDKIIVEIKVAQNYCSDDEPQILNQLRATGIKIGFLINFGRKKVEYKRFVF